MRLIIVRHGETEENVKQITQGHIPGKLSAKGRAQVRDAAKVLSKERIDVIFSSDLKRCRDTTAAIAKFHDAPVHYTSDLREKNYGIYEGGPHIHYRNDLDASGQPRHRFRPKNGENYLDMKRRLVRFARRLPKDYGDKTVLLVTHGGALRCLVSWYLQIPISKAASIPTPKNAGILMLRVNGSKVRVLKNTIIELPKPT